MTQPNPQDQAEKDLATEVWHIVRLIDQAQVTAYEAATSGETKAYLKLDRDYIAQKIEQLITEARKGYVPEDCETCNGTGMEICSNPDHGFIDGVLAFTDAGRIGCPCCGHDEKYRIPNTKCGDCDGTGKVKLHTANELAQAVEEAEQHENELWTTVLNRFQASIEAEGKPLNTVALTAIDQIRKLYRYECEKLPPHNPTQETN